MAENIYPHKLKKVDYCYFFVISRRTPSQTHMDNRFNQFFQTTLGKIEKSKKLIAEMKKKRHMIYRNELENTRRAYKLIEIDEKSINRAKLIFQYLIFETNFQ